MTVGELRNYLDKFPDNCEIWVHDSYDGEAVDFQVNGAHYDEVSGHVLLS